MGLLDSLGLRPEGDAEGMRLYATSLRASAELIEAAGEGAAAGVDAATFIGPAGDATRFRASRLRTRIAARARELRALADAITHEAGAIEDRQGAWDRLKDRIEREAQNLTGSS